MVYGPKRREPECWYPISSTFVCYFLTFHVIETASVLVLVNYRGNCVSDVHYWVHGAISQLSELPTGAGPTPYRITFKLTDFGTGRVWRRRRQGCDPRAEQRRGNDGPPESCRDGYTTTPQYSESDIWYLGAVASEMFVWSIGGSSWSLGGFDFVIFTIVDRIPMASLWFSRLQISCAVVTWSRR